MALTDTDRRRFFLATTVTLLALPALWWVNQSENSTAPNVAVAGAGVGVDVGADHDVSADGGADDVNADAVAPAEDITATESEADTATHVGTETAALSVPNSTIAGSAAAAAADEESIGEIPPVFLEGPSGEVGAGLAEIAVPAHPRVARVTTTATFRSTVGSTKCAIPGMINGRTVVILNLDNNRSVTCETVLVPGLLADQITLSTSMFAELADLTDAPIPVEIHQ